MADLKTKNDVVALLIDYEQFMFIDEIPANERSAAINNSVTRIINFLGYRYLTGVLELKRDEIPNYLHCKIASKWN